MGLIPASLLSISKPSDTLTPLEEWLIARVHARTQVMTHRGAQYKYRGHIISFPKNVPTMHHCLPVPPGQLLDILILRSRNQTDQPNMINQSRTQLRVRRPVVAAWLRHLKANHDGYSDVTIDEDVFSQLPDDGDVNAELQTKDVGPEDLEYLIAEIENDDLGYDVSAIPDLGADETELDRLRGITRRGQGELKPSSHIASATGPQGLQMPAIRSTPISDIRVKARGSYHWLIRCCIPGGRVTSRRLGSARSTANPTCSICFGCIMSALPGILCGHWRYACFNMTMRTQAANRSSYLFKKDILYDSRFNNSVTPSTPTVLSPKRSSIGSSASLLA
ncbi:hypothetical protein E4U44_001228 [Claviceps purpurea]|nr:hypothetical protein E4U44_001228 [Claviceps purpurea]